MSVVHSKGIREIKIGDNEFILVETKWSEVYEWDEVSYKIGEDIFCIGSYYTYDMHISRGWMEYNRDTIAIAVDYNPTYSSSHIDEVKIFDIKSMLFIEGSKEDLLEYYNQKFGDGKENNSDVCFQKSLLIKRQ